MPWTCPICFPPGRRYWPDGEELPEGRVLNDGGQLYRVVQAVTPQAHQAPHDEGMLAVYRPIDREHAGTADDPIPWVYGMDCYAGKCYRYNGKVYRVAEGGDMIPCTWPPTRPACGSGRKCRHKMKGADLPPLLNHRRKDESHGASERRERQC